MLNLAELGRGGGEGSEGRARGEGSEKGERDAKTNLSYNALDRNIAQGRGDQTAIIWEGNEPTDSATLTYQELKDLVCQIANYLKSVGVKKGDRVNIYMPMLPELPATMLACTRIGAIHSVVFAGFSANSLSDRILDNQSTVLITTSGVLRGKKQLATSMTT